MNRTQAGNAVLFILIAVALFGGLAYTFMRGAKTGQGNLSIGQQKIYAEEVINYANLITRTVDKLRSRGCSENEISFEDPALSGYANGSTPVDNSCKVFHSSGGNIAYVAPPVTCIPPKCHATLGTNWVFSSAVRINNIGTVNSELLMRMIIPPESKELCKYINDLSQVTNPSNEPPVSTTTTNITSVATGSFANTDVVTSTDIDGKYTGCYKSHTSTSDFYFFKVLIAR